MNTEINIGVKKPLELECPKCGSVDISRKFVPEGTVFSGYLYGYERYKVRENNFLKRDIYEYKIKKDCIIYNCRCCNYEWETAPIS